MPKRNASGGGSIRQRTDKTWEARYTVGRNPVTGRQIQKSVYGRSQQEVRKKLAAAVAALDAGTYCEPSKLTLSGWLDTWLETYNQNVKVRTKQLYERIINTRIRPALGSVRLAKLDSVIIQKYYNSLTADGLAAKTVRNIHGVLHKALAQAVVLGYIPRNPSDNCELPKKQQLEIHPFEGGSLQNFLQAIQGDAYERLFLVALYTGLREGEVLGLPWDAVDFKKGTLRIYQQVALVKVGERKYERQVTPPKNGKVRIFKIAPSVLELLQEERTYQHKCRQLERCGIQMGTLYLQIPSDIRWHEIRFTNISRKQQKLLAAQMPGSMICGTLLPVLLWKAELPLKPFLKCLAMLQ